MSDSSEKRVNLLKLTFNQYKHSSDANARSDEGTEFQITRESYKPDNTRIFFMSQVPDDIKKQADTVVNARENTTTIRVSRRVADNVTHEQWKENQKGMEINKEKYEMTHTEEVEIVIEAKAKKGRKKNKCFPF